MIVERPTASGQLDIILRDKDGKIKDRQTVKNLIVDTGLAYIADRMADSAESAMSHMAVGTGSTAVAAGNTALGSEAGRVSLTSTTQTNEDVAYIATFGAGVGAGALTEAGIFNASSAGTMLCRTVFSVVNKSASDSLQITWTVSIAS